MKEQRRSLTPFNLLGVSLAIGVSGFELLARRDESLKIKETTIDYNPRDLVVFEKSYLRTTFGCL